jgi:PHD/YefM family antitoxin component YafN of YafNO toxin-antitoxin module
LNNEAVTITSKGGNVVMLSESDWEGIKETLYLMSDPDFMTDVREAENTPLSEREVWNYHTS